MLTHVDVEIIINAFSDNNQKNFDFKDFIDYLSRYSNIKIYAESNTYSNNVLSALLQGRKDTTIRKIDHSFINEKNINIKNPYQVLFINTNNKLTINHLNEEYKYEKGFITDYIFIFKDNHADFFEKLFLKNVTVNNMIISDPYILKQVNGYSLESNYYKLIDTISNRFNLDSLFIFTNHIENFKDILNETKKRLKPKTFLRFIQFNKNHKHHDRHIFTDYYHVKIGGSLNSIYGKSNKNSFSIDIFPYIGKNAIENMSRAKNVLIILKNILDNYNKKNNWNFHNPLFEI
jgi:hypothetical protein